MNYQKQRDKLWKYLGEDKDIVSKSLGYLESRGIKCSYFDLSVVVSSIDLSNSILSMNESYMEECKKVLVKVAYIYCSIPREAIVGLGFDEIANVIRRRFSDLSLNEISLAFELAAIGRFEGVSLRSYGAGFNLDLVGDVMEAYRVWKSRVKWGLLGLCDKVEEMKGVSIENEDSKYVKVFGWWMGIVGNVRLGGEIPRFDLLPIELLLSLNERNFIDYEGCVEVKKEKYIEGISYCISELKREKNENRVMSYVEKQEIIGKLERVKMWRDNGSDLSRDVIPDFLRIEGRKHGLKLFVVDYLEKVKRGEMKY